MARTLDTPIQALQSLRLKCKLNKDRHFAAAERKMFYQTWIGLPVIVINVFVGTILMRFTQTEKPEAWALVLGALCAFLAASLSSFQTFFNFSKMAEGHRSVANRYLKIQILCENLLLKLTGDQISLSRTWEQIDQLTLEYDQINVDSEAFPTNGSDFRKAAKRDSLVPFKLPANDPASLPGPLGGPTPIPTGMPPGSP